MVEGPPVSKLRRRLIRTGSESTANTYIRRLNVFFKRMGKTPEEFLAEIEAGDLYLTSDLNDFLDELAERGRSPSTQAGYVSAVKKFLEVNLSKGAKLRIDWDDVALPRIDIVEEDAPLTKDIIRRTLLHADAQQRALSLVALSSGMREGTLAKLTVSDVDLDPFEVGVFRVPKKKAKGRVKYTAFITPEAKGALMAYLDERRRKGEEVGPESPLFATRLGGWYSRPDKLALRWIRLLELAGLDAASRKWRDYRFHTLRKFFRTAMETAGVSRSFRERMMGHRGDYLDVAYFTPEFDKLLEEYCKAVPALTILEEAGVTEGRVVDLEEELKATKEALEVLRSGVQAMFGRRLDKLGVPHDKPLHEMAREAGWPPRGTQMMVNEDELADYLSRGWRFVSPLNNGSGKCIVEKAQ